MNMISEYLQNALMKIIQMLVINQNNTIESEGKKCDVVKLR